MKNITSTILVCIATLNLQSQCLEAPDINFLGAKVEWSIGTIDTFVKSPCVKYIKPNEAFFTLNDPIEMSDKIIYSLSNIKYGTIVQGINTKDGDIKWKNYYNSTTQDGYGYNYYMEIMNESENQLNLYGTRYPIKTASEINTNYGGNVAFRSIETRTGKDIFEHVIDSEIEYFVSSSKFHKSQNKSFYYNCALLGSNFYVNGNNYRCIYKSADFSENKLEATQGDTLYFNSRDDDKFPNPPRTKGPFIFGDSLYVYLTQYSKNGKFYQHIWSVDIDGRLIQNRDISEQINGIDDQTYFIDTKQQGDEILLTTITVDDSYEGHYGYIILSHDGIVKKNNAAITIQGKNAGFMAVVKLKNSDEYLLSTRLQGQNDIYFYREKPNNEYTEVAHLVNPNRSVYALWPYNLLQTADNGIVMTGSFVLDTFKLGNITPFQAGGWPVIMKLSAETLGIATSTQDQHEIWSFTITPNPASEQISVTVPESLGTRFVHMSDQTGRTILMNPLAGPSTQIDISHINSGVYFVFLTDDKGSRIGKVQKFVKIY